MGIKGMACLKNWYFEQMNKIWLLKKKNQQYCAWKRKPDFGLWQQNHIRLQPEQTKAQNRVVMFELAQFLVSSWLNLTSELLIWSVQLTSQPKYDPTQIVPWPLATSIQINIIKPKFHEKFSLQISNLHVFFSQAVNLDKSTER